MALKSFPQITECETTSEIPCDLQTAGPLAINHNSSFVFQPFRLGQVNEWGFAPQTLISSSFAVATKSL